MIFDQKKEGYLLSYFTTDEKIFVVLNTAVFQLSYREILIFLNIPRKDLTDSLQIKISLKTEEGSERFIIHQNMIS